MTPSPEDRKKMTPEQLEQERKEQEELFEHLTSHLSKEPLKPRLTLWQRLNRAVDWSVRGFIQWILVVVLLSIIVHLVIALLGI